MVIAKADGMAKAETAVAADMPMAAVSAEDGRGDARPAAT